MVNLQDKKTALRIIECAKAGNAAELASALVAAKPELLTVRDEKDTNALMWAAYYGHTSCVDLLLAHGASPFGQGVDAVDLAASRGHVEALRRLVNGVPVIELQSPFFNAASHGQFECVKFLVECGVPAFLKDSVGVSALIEAMAAKSLKTVRYLIKQGAHLNHWFYESFGYGGDNDPSTDYSVLTFAVRCGKRTTTILVEAGADINFEDGNGDTPLDVALDLRKTELATYLKSKGAERAPRAQSPKNGRAARKNAGPFLPEALVHAAARGDLDAVKHAVKQGLDLRTRAEHGSTLLQTAVNHGKEEMALYLLDAGADPRFGGSDLVTPMLMAVEKGMIATIKRLLQAGVTPMCANKYGVTAIDELFVWPNPEVARALGLGHLLADAV